MVTFSRVTFLICCLSLLTGCDQICMQRAVIDFRQNTPRSFTVSKSGDFNALFSRIEQIANKQDLKCKFNEMGKTSYVCRGGSVTLAVYVTSETSVTIELSQFGPHSKTLQFSMLEQELSTFLASEFPGKHLQIVR